MNPAAPYRSRGQRIGELSLWTGASILILTAHIAAAALLMQEEPVTDADSAPPSAIMIELAPEPQAVNTEEEQISPDMADVEKVESEQTEPVEEAQPEPTPEPVPDPVEPPPEVTETPEPPPPEQVVEEPTPPEPPEPEIAQPLPEPPPEPIEEPKPIEEQMTAALDNVEVPLPVVRPPPPPPEVTEKPEPKKEPVKKVERRKQQQARKEMAQAKAQVEQSDRNAASQSATGSISTPNVSPARWMTRVRAKIARNARRCPGGDRGVVAVSFSFDGSGNIGRVSVAQSSGNSQIDDYVTSAIRNASPLPAPPTGVASTLTQSVVCK
jgi:protein TonB